ncbi:hypothetical protein F5884DRAFT_768887 [Xylogone sp. PMI_703]|nr:hypothetical protein F5884DRAFT_768887 [Xylogone sp. PMI_703]
MALILEPPNSRFQPHVSFDNFAGGEPTEKNTISFTLNVKHKGYQFKKRSRTFMVGIDENAYSDIALQWMLEELVDDGDEIICLRVIEKDSKMISDRNLERKQYQDEARILMEQIQKKNDDNRAISIVLEFAVGKVHTTFQKMIQIYEPAMLIVGTRGRSLGGFQGLVSNRNSFSKWCLQYSPIPVVVVRPTEQRLKKKKKRDADPTRQDYARILRESGINGHETNAGASTPILEATNDEDAEAHAVASALGLPAQFDPTIKPVILETSLSHRKRPSRMSDATDTSRDSFAVDSRAGSPEAVMKSPISEQLDSPMMSGDDFSDEDEGDFEVVSGHTLLGKNVEEVDHSEQELERKKKLALMEQGEAAALAAGRKASVASLDSSGSGKPGEDDEEEAEGRMGPSGSSEESLQTP